MIPMRFFFFYSWMPYRPVPVPSPRRRSTVMPRRSAASLHAPYTSDRDDDGRHTWRYVRNVFLVLVVILYAACVYKRPSIYDYSWNIKYIYIYICRRRVTVRCDGNNTCCIVLTKEDKKKKIKQYMRSFRSSLVPKGFVDCVRTAAAYWCAFASLQTRLQRERRIAYH